MRRGRIFWALMLLLAGMLLLLNNFDVIQVDVWSLFWPSFLILLGVWILVGSLSKTPPRESEKSSISLEDASEARVQIKHGAGRLQVSGGAAPADLLTGVFGWGLEKDVRRREERIDVVMRPAHGIFPDVIFPWTWASGHGLDWEIALNEELPLDLRFETGAGEASLDFSTVQVKNLRLQTGASSTRVKLPENAGHTTMKVEAGVASVSIQVPEGVAANIQSVSGLSSINVDQNRFPKKNGSFISEDYQTAQNTVEIRIETGVGSVKIT